MIISFLFSFFNFASWGRFSFQGDLARSWKMRRKIFFLVILLIVNKHRLIRSRLRRCPLWFKKQRHFYAMHKNQPELSRNTFWSETINNKKAAKTHNLPDKIVQWYILFSGAFFDTSSIIRTSRMTPTWFIHWTQNSLPGLKIEVFAFTFLALEAIEMKKWCNPSRRLPHRNMSQH